MVPDESMQEAGQHAHLFVNFLDIDLLYSHMGSVLHCTDFRCARRVKSILMSGATASDLCVFTCSS